MYNRVYPVNAASSSDYRDKSGKLKMRNLRAEYHWRLRDVLDPQNGEDAILSDDRELLADLCAARYSVSISGVIIEEKEKIKERIGRSPDKGEAVMLCNLPAGSAPLPEEQPSQTSKWLDEGDHVGWAKRY